MKCKEEDISIEQLMQARKIAAKVVSLYGQKYLPIFTRLNEELKKFDDTKRLIDLALQIAQ
jgi:hypothetical protein